MATLSRSQRWALVGVVAVGVVLRVAWALYATREPRGLHDPAIYRLLAHGIAHLDGYQILGEPTAYYPVGYPAILGALFGLGRLVGADGPTAETAIPAVLNVLAGGASVVLAFALGRRTAGAWAGIAAAAVVAAMPNLVFHTALVLTELVFVALALAGAVVLASAPWERGGPGTRRLVVAGLLLGVSALVRPVVVPVIPLLGAVWWAAGLGWRRALRDLAVLSAAFVAVIVPWTVRNVVRMDALVVISTNTGDNLCMSRQEGATGAFLLTEHCFGGDDLAGLGRREYELRRDERGRELALEWVLENPGQEVRLWLSRLGATFRHGHDAIDAVESFGEDRFLSDAERDLLRRAADTAWYVLGPLAAVVAAAVIALRPLRHDPRLVLLVAFAVGLLVPVVVFFGDARFKVPAVPFLAVLVPCVAVAALRSSGSRGRHARSHEVPTPVS